MINWKRLFKSINWCEVLVYSLVQGILLSLVITFILGIIIVVIVLMKML